MRSIRTLAALGLLAGGLLSAQQIPRPAMMDYTVTLVNGQHLKLSQYKGKAIAVEFLLTTCSHCQKAAQTLAKLKTEFGDRFQPIGIAVNDNPNIPEFIKLFNVNFPVGFVDRSTVYDFLQHSVMNPRMNFPQIVFIDKDGNVQAQHEGGTPFLEQNQEANVRGLVQRLVAPVHAKTPAVKKTAAQGKKA